MFPFLCAQLPAHGLSTFQLFFSNYTWEKVMAVKGRPVVPWQYTVIIFATKPNGWYKNTSCTHLRCQNKNRDKLHIRWRHVDETQPFIYIFAIFVDTYLVQHSCKMLQVSFPKAGCMQKSLFVQHSQSSTGPAQQTGNAHKFRPIPVQKGRVYHSIIIIIIIICMCQQPIQLHLWSFMFPVHGQMMPNESHGSNMLTSAVYKLGGLP